MTDAPDFIWARPDNQVGWFWPETQLADLHDAATTPMTRYVRCDPAVMAELPEVKALVAAAVMKAAKVCDDYWIDYTDELPLPDAILALTPADAKAALDAYVAAEVRLALERAAENPPEAAVDAAMFHAPSPYEQDIGDRDAFVLWVSAVIRAVIEEATK